MSQRFTEEFKIQAVKKL